MFGAIDAESDVYACVLNGNAAHEKMQLREGNVVVFIAAYEDCTDEAVALSLFGTT